MNFKRIARMLVCLVLVCALVVNISPIKAKAVEPISATLGIGLAVCMILGVAGVILCNRPHA